METLVKVIESYTVRIEIYSEVQKISKTELRKVLEAIRMEVESIYKRMKRHTGARQYFTNTFVEGVIHLQDTDDVAPYFWNNTLLFDKISKAIKSIAPDSSISTTNWTKIDDDAVVFNTPGA